MKTAIIILAAGASSRMGKSKLNLLIEGQPLFTRIILEANKALAARIVVVTGAHPLPEVAINFDIVKNEHWERGIGSSIKTGLEHLLRVDRTFDGALFLVADQPFVTATHLNALINDFNAHNQPVASHYNDTPGVPALFPRRMFAALQLLRDDQGAKAILQRNPNELRLIAFPEGAIDLDTSDDYQNFINRKESFS